jgi:RNA polymerase sigma factor (sigma-70 family)
MLDTDLRELVPQVLSVLVRRGADFATAEDAVQEAMIRAAAVWGNTPPTDAKGWLITVAWRVFIDVARTDASRRDREERFDAERSSELAPGVDDTLHLYFLCAHPGLSESSAVALTLRVLGGLTTRQIAQAYLVPEATMAQRISRAKRTVSEAGLDRRGNPRTVMRVLYLIFNEGYTGDVDLAAEAIRLTRQLAMASDEPEVHGLLALMLLHHARHAGRTAPDGRLVPLAEQDRTLWDADLIAEGIVVLQAALSRDRLGEYQAQAAIAALHADAMSVDDTDWAQIVGWYDELLRCADTDVVRLNRAVAVGEAEGADVGLAALAAIDPHVPRYDAVAAYLHERRGDLETAARLYADAARTAPNQAEREHQVRQAARVNEMLSKSPSTDRRGRETTSRTDAPAQRRPPEMQFLIFVLDDATNSATPAEMAAIDAFNDRLVTGGHWVLAGGLTTPSAATVIDGRGERAMFTDGPFIETKEYIGGFWVITAPDRETALALAAEGSRCCNRRVEVRPFLGD